MRILSFDTSAEACSVALLYDGQCHEKNETTPRQHAQTLLPFIRSLLEEHNFELDALDAIAFGCGPGSFTGLRIAAGVAQGLSYGSGCPVMPVSNLRAMALQAASQTELNYILPAFDARMDEVYWAGFELRRDADTGQVLSVEMQQQEQVCGPENMRGPEAGVCYGLGSAYTFVERFNARLKSCIASYDADARPHARDIAMLAKLDLIQGKACVEAAQAKPVYIRDDVAWKKLPGRT